MTQDSPQRERYSLCLYVAGSTGRSRTAIANLREVCEAHLAGRYDLEVIDLQEYPRLAAAEQIFAVPTLVRRLPGSSKQIIGSLASRDRLLSDLEIAPRPAPP
jgi:circadian clock protein KaiB